MDIEFAKALKKLKEDDQLVDLQLSKLEGWMLLTPVQIAFKHPKANNYTTIKKAVKLAKRIQFSVVGESSILEAVAESAWKGESPRVSLTAFRTEFMKLETQMMKLLISKEEVWCLILSTQLAFRHPEYKTTEAAKVNKKILDQLATAIPEGILSISIKAGWDTLFDRE